MADESQAQAQAAQAAMAQLEGLQRQMQNVERRLGNLEASILEAQEALATLEAVQDGQAEGPVLLPLGGGIHVRVRFEKDTPVLRAIGSGTAVDGSLEEAVEALKARRDKLSGSFQEGSQTLQRLGQQAMTLQQQLGG